MELPGYHALTALAEGGMAHLYTAIQTSLGRRVAIKILKQGEAPELMRTMFDREASIIARLDHPHIIRIIDRGVAADGTPFFVMDYVEGKTLKAMLLEGGVAHGEKLRVSLQIAKALAYAHKNNIVHRDIKPGNIIVDGEGDARVLDFGIALLQGDAHTPGQDDIAAGTETYMAPEQHQGARFATAASDIYSLGVVMYLLFAGTLPTRERRAPITFNSSVPQRLSDLIMGCLAAQAPMRPTAEQVILALLELTGGAHLTARERRDAQEAFSDPKEKFLLLDVILNTPYSSVYLYENRATHSLMVLKKRSGSFNGFREADFFYRVPHPHIVRIHGVSRNERIFILIMEYLSGGSLQSRLARTLSVDEFMPVAAQICDAMAYAHQHRIVHGNLRPHNILFDKHDDVKLTDFGMDRHYEGRPEDEWYSIKGETPSVKGDIYSAGVIFYQMLIGALPSWNGSRLLDGELRHLPQPLAGLLREMLTRDTESRLGSFEVVRARLQMRAGLADKTEAAAGPLPEASDAGRATPAQDKPAPVREPEVIRSVTLDPYPVIEAIGAPRPVPVAAPPAPRSLPQGWQAGAILIAFVLVFWALLPSKPHREPVAAPPPVTDLPAPVPEVAEPASVPALPVESAEKNVPAEAVTSAPPSTPPSLEPAIPETPATVEPAVSTPEVQAPMAADEAAPPVLPPAPASTEAPSAAPVQPEPAAVEVTPPAAVLPAVVSPDNVVPSEASSAALSTPAPVEPAATNDVAPAAPGSAP